MKGCLVDEEKGVTAMEAVEKVLLDFDVIAVPYHLGIAAAKDAADIYKDVLKSTAPYIVPFAAIQMALRRNYDYKFHYLELLKDFEIWEEEGLDELIAFRDKVLEPPKD